MKNLKEFLQKQWLGIAFGLYVGVMLGLLMGAGLSGKKKGFEVSILFNYNSSEKICLDDIVTAYVSTGTILSNPEKRKLIEQIYSKDEEYLERPFREYAEGITPELGRKRMRQLLAFAAGVK